MQQTGYSQGEIIGKPFVDLLPEKYRLEIGSRLDEVITQRSTIRPERTVPVVAKTGQKKQIQWSSVLLVDKDASGNTILGIGRDITDQLLAERDRDQAIGELEAGAFTGATSLRKGKFELAKGGILFLDEIAEMPLAAQSKLLNVIQERVIERVGGSQSIEVDVHILAATNRVLETAVEQGRFRSDLYYRLNIYPITIPSLRARKSDIAVLTKHFITVFNRQFGKQIDSVPPAVLEQLENYSWPGNVRELRNVIERGIITGDSNVFSLPGEALSMTRQNQTGIPIADDDLLPLADVERLHILRALEATQWQISGRGGAASILKMNPSTLRSRIKKHNLEKP